MQPQVLWDGLFGYHSGKEGACGLSIPFVTAPGQEHGAKQSCSLGGQQGSAVLQRSDLRWLCAAAPAVEPPTEKSGLCNMIKPEKKVLETASLR